MTKSRVVQVLRMLVLSWEGSGSRADLIRHTLEYGKYSETTEEEIEHVLAHRLEDLLEVPQSCKESSLAALGVHLLGLRRVKR